MKRRDFLMSTGGAAALGAATMASPAKDSPTSQALPAGDVMDPTYIDPRLDSRSVSFENPTGARSGGGRTGRGRKDHPSHIFEPGEKVVLANLEGPGTLRHIWMTCDNWQPEVLRALRFEVFYDGLAEPSISVPMFDFFGLPHGRRAEYYSALVSVNEGRGFNSYIPMPFGRSVRVEFTNESARHVTLFYQIDYTLEPSIAQNPSYLHVSFRRENPTTLREDFVIAQGLKGPGRFLGCAVGIRVIEKGPWYGEGEVKIYRDGDRDFPTICGTGLEDYVGSAWGLGRHYGDYCGAPINIPPPSPDATPLAPQSPDFVSFYRWHLPDPVMFAHELRVTIQQIGAAFFAQGQEAEFEAYQRKHPAADHSWITDIGNGMIAVGLVERVDDYCATAFVYCRQPQPVSRFETEMAIRDIGLLPHEVKPQLLSEDQQDQVNVVVKKHWKE